jgi:cytochrome P450
MHDSPLGIWVLSRHGDVTAALRNPLLGSDESKADASLLRLGGIERLLSRGHRSVEERGPFQQMFSRLMLFRDPPDHTRLRGLVAKAFTPRRAESLAPRIAELVDEILDRVAPAGHMELMRELAYPLPARVICELLGVPRQDEELIVAQAPALAVGLDPSPMRTAVAVAAADQAATVIGDYLADLIALRRRQPGDDLLSALIEAEEGGAGLDHDELVATAMLLLIAGHETTANLIGNGMLALLRHPRQLEQLRRDPGLDRPAVDELLRFDSPVQMVQRIALDDVTISGTTIPKGHIVVLCTGAANRDPAAFHEPNQLDLGRSPNPHLAFGGGAHFCIGAPLARIEARLVIGRVIRRFPGLHMTGRTEHWRPSFTIRGLEALPLAW